MLSAIYGCQEALERLDDYLDRELAPGERQQVAAHLAICLECARHYGFERAVLADVRLKLARVEAPPALMNRIRLALQAAEER